MAQEFKRVLGALDATALVMGTVIGSGIFLTTGIIAKEIPSPFWLIVVWIVGGIISLAGALTYAELAVLLPEAGGAYAYIRNAYGAFAGFIYGWMILWVLQCGSIAAIAHGFAHYFGRFVPILSMERIWASFDIAFGFKWQIAGGHIAAGTAILVLTIINIFGVKKGATAQNTLTMLKTGGLLFIFIFGVITLFGREEVAVAGVKFGAPSLSAFGVALIAVLWTYAGWNNINFAAEEIKNLRRNISLALIGGMGIVIALYLMVNVIYIYAMPTEELRGVVPVAERVAERLWGLTGANLIACLVLVSTLGALNGLILTSPRAYFAMARDGWFAGVPARLHSRYLTPHIFLWIQFVWSAVLVFSGGYEALFTYVMFSGFLFATLVGAALFILQRDRRKKDLIAGWAYPWAPAFYTAVSAALAINTLIEKPLESLGGLLLLAAGVPVYFWIKRRKSAREGAI